MTDLLVLDDVGKSFGALRAVDGVSFSVAAGEVLGIAGPNGSGKSTLFNIITGIPFRPDRGAITFAGERIERLAPHLIARRGIARTFQTETDFETLSVEDNMLTALAQRRDGLGHAERVREARRLLDFVGVAAAPDRTAGEISVFDRKKLMIATALALRPKLLLLDEPASGLSQPEVEGTIALIRAINATGVAIVLIEHVISLLMSVSARLVVLNFGSVLASGDPVDVVRDPRVVEAYLGAGAGRDLAAA